MKDEDYKIIRWPLEEGEHLPDLHRVSCHYWLVSVSQIDGSYFPIRYLGDVGVKI